MDYFVLNYEDLDSQASKLDIPYSILEAQFEQAKVMNGQFVFFRKYELWHWVIVDNRIPIDWFMALVLA